MRSFSFGFSGPRKTITFTDHARRRMAERGFTEDDVQAILRYGKRQDAGEGKLLYILEPNPFIALDPTGTMCDLVDCVVLIGEDGAVVTAYRADARCPVFRATVVTD